MITAQWDRAQETGLALLEEGKAPEGSAPIELNPAEFVPVKRKRGRPRKDQSTGLAIPAKPQRGKIKPALQWKIARLALAGCSTTTIATLCDLPVSVMENAYGKLLKVKRAERKYTLYCIQNELAKTNPAVAIFLGKNELGQVDRRELGGQVTLAQAFASIDGDKAKTDESSVQEDGEAGRQDAPATAG